MMFNESRVSVTIVGINNFLDQYRNKGAPHTYKHNIVIIIINVVYINT